MKKKILFIMSTMENGGAERSLVNLLNEIPYDKYNVDLLIFKKTGIFLKQIPKQVNILKRPMILKRLYGSIKESGIMYIYKLFATLTSFVFERDKDKAYQTGYRWKTFYKKIIPNLNEEYDTAVSYISGEQTYYLVDKVKAKRKISWVHNDYRAAHHPKKYDEQYFNKLDAIVTISEKCEIILKEEFPELKDRCHNIANITSSEIIKRMSNDFYPKEYEKIPLILLSIGRLSPQKGFDLAINVAKILKDKNIEFKWFIIGEGKLRKDLQNQINELEIQDVIELIGIRENPYPYIKNCDIFVQTSKYEGKSVVVDECKILAKPMVLTNYPTVYDQIDNEYEAIIAEMNPKDIANKIKVLIDDKNLNEKMTNYLKNHEYGNQNEIVKYLNLIG